MRRFVGLRIILRVPKARDLEVPGVLGCQTLGLRDRVSFPDVAVSKETERQRADHHQY